MVEILNNNSSCINVYSDELGNDWMNCVFVIPKEQEKKAADVLSKAWDAYWEDSNAHEYTYGDWLSKALKEADISFEVFYAPEEDCSQ